MHPALQDESRQERDGRIFAGWIAWLLCMVALAAVLSLSGCASVFAGQCGVLPLGQTEQGVTVVRVVCKADE